MNLISKPLIPVHNEKYKSKRKISVAQPSCIIFVEPERHYFGGAGVTTLCSSGSDDTGCNPECSTVDKKSLTIALILLVLFTAHIAEPD
jgi:hypothetical protein